MNEDYSHYHPGIPSADDVSADEEMLDALGEYRARQTDIEDEYMEFLQAELGICNGDDLVKHFERGTLWEAFLADRSV